MDIRSYKKELETRFPEASKKVKNDLALQIGNEVERYRIAHALTQNELAEKVGTQQSGISRLEKGSTLPSLRFLQKIANALEMFVECKFYPFVSPSLVSLTVAPRTKTTYVSYRFPALEDSWLELGGHSYSHQNSSDFVAK